MKKILLVATGLLVAWTGSAFAHGPTRQKVTETIEINAAPEVVWGIIKDFGKGEWMPQVASSTGTGGNEKGATRELKLKSGGIIKEELKSYDAEKMSYSYKITEVDPKDLPVANYSSSIAVTASGAGSVVEWNGAFYRSFMNNNPPPEENDEAALKAVTSLYKEGLANLKALAEKK
ncbi:SRPBCC family protein [Methylococcus geothermalis]|uniref:SRPBCC family protein n=1 Tax=Methylococcus geothermalis TaxID=2681310 RepID=A0A858QB77_9GAMM|nr:SRPBCC family protein [Methylococcus geothermalis]QJD31073.1 SRPBCC family protein [Methylococcus geothermalis]